MKRLPTAWIIVLLLTGVGIIGLWLRHQAVHPRPSQTALVTKSPTNSPVVVTNPATDATEPMDFNTVRTRLATLDSTNAVAEIIRLLRSGQDISTGQGFKLNPDGSLKETPTLRIYLLDELRRLDPAAAAAYAKEILEAKSSPDEWALALRNLAAGDTSPEARALLKQKFAEMLTYAPWQQSPSAGYLEAFDTAVYLGDAGLTAPLTSLVCNQDNPATAHAAYLALDRMVINNPTAMLTALASDPSLMQGRENTRADYFARADVQDGQQRQILESYLLNPQISPAELAQFAGIFPNANFMISPNLLTSNPTPNHAALVARDAASLQVVGQWLADPRFASRRSQLQVMQQRLQQFVQQEQAAGH